MKHPEPVENIRSKLPFQLLSLLLAFSEAPLIHFYIGASHFLTLLPAMQPERNRVQIIQRFIFYCARPHHAGLLQAMPANHRAHIDK